MALHNEHLSVAPPSAGRLVGGLLVLLVLGALGLSQLDYSQREYVDGFIQPEGGELRLVSPVQGVVTYTAAVGATVQPGQAIATIRSPQSLAGGQSLLDAQRAAYEAKSASVKTELATDLPSLAAKQAALRTQRTMAQAAVDQTDAEVRTRQESLQLEEAKVSRQRDLRAKGLIPQSTLEQAQTQLLTSHGDLQAAQRAATQARAQVAALDADLAGTQAQTATQREQLQRELSTLEQASAESEHQAEASIQAPQAAVVAALMSATGNSVQAGQLLAKLVPAGAPMQALLLLPGTAAGRIKVGQSVALQMAAYPYQTYGLVYARITQIEATSVLADESSLHGLGVPAGTVVMKATATLTDIPKEMGGAAAMRSGMQFNAAVEVERKSFLAWMVWPLLRHFQ